MNKLTILFLGMLASACTTTGIGNLEAVVVKKAAFDFNCPESAISILAEGITTYAAKGCGRQDVYEVKCSLGPCVAKPVR